MELDTISQEDVEELMNDICGWNSEDAKALIGDHLPSLLICFSSQLIPENEVQVGHFITASLLPLLSWDEPAQKLLQQSILSANKCLTLLIEKFMFETHPKDCEFILESLRGCLDSEKQAINYLQSLGKDTVLLGQISDTPFLEMMCKILDFIKIGDSKFPSLFKKLLEDCSEVALIFSDLLPILKINAACEEIVGPLISVCHSLANLARKLSIAVRVKASIKTWNCMMTLVQDHDRILDDSIDLHPLFRHLLEEISEHFEVLGNYKEGNLLADEGKMIERAIKLIGFFLKIVVAICEKFNNGLHNSFEVIIEITFLLLRYSPYGWVLQNFPARFKDVVGQKLTIAAEPIIREVYAQEGFAKVIQNAQIKTYSKLTAKKVSAYETMLVYIHIMKALIQDCNYDILSIWSPYLLERVIDLLPKCHIELCIPLTLPGIMHGGRPQENIPFYSYVLIHVCGFISILNACQFVEIEAVLFKNILSEEEFVTQLTSDVLTYIGRYSREELCKTHVTCLIKLLETNDICAGSRTVLINLYKRLFALLNERKQTEIMEMISNGQLDDISKLKLLHLTDLDEYKEIFGKLCEQFLASAKSMDSITIDDFSSLIIYMKRLTCLMHSKNLFEEVKNLSDLEAVSEKILFLFERIPMEFMSYDVVKNFWMQCMEYFVVSSLQSKHILRILEKLKLTSIDEDMCMCVGSFIERCFSKEFGDVKIITSSTDLIVQLLMEKNVFVKGFGKYVARNVPNSYNGVLKDKMDLEKIRLMESSGSLESPSILKSIYNINLEDKNRSCKIIDSNEVEKYEKKYVSLSRKRKSACTSVLNEYLNQVNQLEKTTEEVIGDLSPSIASNVCMKLENIIRMLNNMS